MKKVMMLALGLGLALGSAAFATPQDDKKMDDKKTDKNKKKKRKMKKADTTATDKKM